MHEEEEEGGRWRTVRGGGGGAVEGEERGTRLSSSGRVGVEKQECGRRRWDG